MKFLSLDGIDLFNVGDKVMVRGKFIGRGEVISTFYPDRETFSELFIKEFAEAKGFLILQPFPQLKVKIGDKVVIYNAEDILEGKVQKIYEGERIYIDQEIEIANLMVSLWKAMDERNFEECKKIKIKLEKIHKESTDRRDIDEYSFF